MYQITNKKAIPSYCKSIISSLLIIVLFGLVPSNSYALQETNGPVVKTKERIDLIPYTNIYQIEEKITVAELDLLIRSNKINTIEQKSSHGISDFYYWIRFQIDWQKQDHEVYIELDNPHVNEVLLFEQKGNQYNKIGFGGDSNYTFHDRSYRNRRHIFPLSRHDGETTYYLMVDKKGASVSFPLWLWNKTEFEKQEASSTIFFGFYFGIIFLIGILSLIIGVIMWKKIFISYGLYTLCLSSYIFTSLGFSFQYWYPFSTNLNNLSRIILAALLNITLINFILLFLHIKENAPKIAAVLKGIRNFYVLGFILWFLFPNIYDNLNKTPLYTLYLSFIILVLLFIASAIKALKTHQRNVVTFFLSFLFVLIGFGIYDGVEVGFINQSQLYANPLLLAFGLEIAALTVAMMLLLRDIVVNSKVLLTKKEFLEQDQLHLKAENLQLKANNKLLQKKNSSNTEEVKIILKSKAVLSTNDILYITSDGHYLEFYLRDKKNPEIDRNSLKNMLLELPNNFIQIHRSHIINTGFLKIIKATSVTLNDGKQLPLSRSHKETLNALIKK